VVIHGQRFYVKGTPRSQPEARVTQRLADHCPTLLPDVLATDRLPPAPWCWFLMADAGACDHTVLELDRAIQAAYTLGTLQRTMQPDRWFAHHLPPCQPQQLQHQTLQVCQWLLAHGDAETQARVRMVHASLTQATPYFHHLAAALSVLPPSCVHGDCWPGNIAVHATGVRIIAWGDAVWGVGGAAIWNLLLTSQPSLAHQHATIWDAYSRGWDRPVSAAYIEAAYSAHMVTMLVVDWGFAAWHPADVDLAPGMLATLEHLVERIGG